MFCLERSWLRLSFCCKKHGRKLSQGFPRIIQCFSLTNVETQAWTAPLPSPPPSISRPYNTLHIWRHIMLICRFLILFWVTTRTGLHALLLKKQYYRTVQCCSTVSPSHWDTLFYLLSLWAPPSWIPRLLWLVSSPMPDPALLTTGQLC